jgi:lipopolysaccharide transport system ATP-binding protein
VVDEVLAVGDAEFQKKAVGKMQEVSRGEGRTVLFVSHNMASVRTLCNKGVLLQDGCMSFTGNIEETIDLYVKTDEIDETELIINKIKPISKEIQITNVLVNNSATSILTLSHPNNTITIQVQGKCLNDVRGAIEVLIFDTHNVLLAKYAPALKSGIASKIKAGNFSMKETVSLPDQMTNGVYYLQINITNPNIEFLAKIPKAVKVISNNFTGKTGISIDYKHSGFLSLS